MYMRMFIISHRE